MLIIKNTRTNAASLTYNFQVPCPKTGGYREGFLESGGDIANIGAEGADLTVKLVVVS